MSSDRLKPVQGPYLNPEALICEALPRLHEGPYRIETVSSAPSIVRRYLHTMAEWVGFVTEVIDWYQRPETQAEFLACSHCPVYMDPGIENWNSYAMTRELGQIGDEISLSGRFNQNALLPVLHAAHTMRNPSTAGSPVSLPTDMTFGDSFIVQKSDRDSSQRPDVVMKLTLDGRSEVRLIGEMKSCATVDLKKLEREAAVGSEKQKPFHDTLAQAIEYMVGYGTKYGFITNYTHTIFLKIDSPENGSGPSVFYSSPIQSDHKVELTNHGGANATKSTISIRLAMLYMVFKCRSSNDNDWRLSKETQVIAGKWVQKIQKPSKASGFGEALAENRRPSQNIPAVRRGGAPDPDKYLS